MTTTFISNSNLFSGSPTPKDVCSRERVAFIQSCWHQDIVNELRDSFLQEFAALSEKKVDLFEVPGAFEIPLHAKYLASSGKYAAVVTAGLVVDGDVYRHEFVAATIIDGLMKIQLDTGTPVFSAVLTPHDFISEGQPEFFKKHFVTKGVEAAVACADTLKSLATL